MKRLIILSSFILFLIVIVFPVNADPFYTANAVWIQDAGWPAMNRNILPSNITKVLNDLSNNFIKYAFVMVGYYNGSSPTDAVLWQHTTTGGYMDGGPPNATFYTSVVNALHSKNITTIAWIEDTNDPYGINIDPTNWGNLEAQINYTLQWGFDGYNDDIESVNGTHQDQVNWWNNVTVWLHSLGKLSMPDVGFDWQQNTNQYLHVDAIVSMFYSSRSTLEDVQAPYYWQEEFGEWSGHNTPPASPVILGIMNYYGNRYPLAWQLGQAGKYLSLYGHPQLAGFSFWLYEYMGTNPDDWSQWNYWINRIGTTTPSLYTITFNSSPITGIQLSYNDIQHYTPAAWYTFNGTTVVNAPSQVSHENHNVLFGDSDHSGGSEGYSSYTYAGGPYNLTSSADVSSIYIYCATTGNVKLAIYNATYYYISSWNRTVTSDGYDYHPYMLLTQSSPTACTANSWKLISVPTVTLPAGIYFIVIKGDTTSIIGVSGLAPQVVGGDIYGYDQFITESYGTAFKQTFPTVEGAMGNEPSTYVPTVPFTLTTYNFDHWEDSSTDPTRAINLNSNTTITASYTTTSTINKISGTLKDKNNQPVQAKVIAYQNGTNIMVGYVQTNSSGYYSLQVPNGTYDVQFNLTNFYIPDYSIKLNSINVTNDTFNLIQSITGNQSENKVYIVLDVNNSQNIQIYSSATPSKIAKNNTYISSVSSLSQLIKNTWFYQSSNLYMMIAPEFIVTALSGSATDIQEAVNQVLAAGGGTVYIPAGDWQVDQTSSGAIFIDLETLPSGAWLNIIGSYTNVTTTQQNGISITCPTTILRSTVVNDGSLPSAIRTFSIVGSNWTSQNMNYVKSQGRHIRISGLTILGDVINDSGNGNSGISLNYVDGFRIDHSCIDSNSQWDIGTGSSKGLVDHSYLSQLYHKALGGLSGWGYGVAVFGNSGLWHNGFGQATWITNLTQVIGKYDWQGINITYSVPESGNFSVKGATTNISFTAGPVYVEDCTFDYTRHAVASAQYAYYVLRYSNLIHNLGALQMNDIHGQPFPSGRAVEIYDNTFTGDSPTIGHSQRGGGGVIFSNIFNNIYNPIQLSTENYQPTTDPNDSQYVQDIWIWANTFNNCAGTLNVWANNGNVPGVTYFSDVPTSTNPAPPRPNYMPYQYPHPLALES